MRTTTWLIDWASCWTAPGDMPEGGAVELPEDIPLPAISAIRTASPADSRRYRMALPLFAWAGMGPIIAPRPPMSRSPGIVAAVTELSAVRITRRSHVTVPQGILLPTNRDCEDGSDLRPGAWRFLWRVANPRIRATTNQ